MDSLLQYLHTVYGPNAKFREGQYEAIKAVLSGRRTLVVQRTGWGKSLVYFLSTKILREQGKGPCLVISPLLALMRNQVEAARKFGLRAYTINSSNQDAWEDVFRELEQDRIDILFIAPERLSNSDFLSRTIAVVKNISMLVVDEAHCISDWGHDFRPDYLRIRKILQYLPPHVPLLATTATANNRVIADIEQQFGGNISLIRGSLLRNNLHIYVLRHLQRKAERLVWLSTYLPYLPGTGIIYCLTTADCECVADWLKLQGIAAEAYFSKNKNKEEKAAIEEKFYHNEIKAVVATSALGMGIDKPDIDFIIHFQKPGNVIAYYQQIGRAGRMGQSAYAILLLGNEDDEINRYFIQSAFPKIEWMRDVVKALDQSETGLTKTELLQQINLSDGKIDKILKLLEVNDDVYRVAGMYYRTPKKWQPNYDEMQAITLTRQQELYEMNQYVSITGCYMKYITGLLDDPNSKACGQCGNCTHKSLREDLQNQKVLEAESFLRRGVKIIPRKKWPDKKKIPEDKQLQIGLALSNYADAGWGALVKQDKYVTGAFTQPLIDASVQALSQKCHEWKISAVIAVPSLRRPHLVSHFARAVAEKLGIPYLDGLKKIKDVPEQKTQQNSMWQYRNAEDSFEVTQALFGNVLLIDDMVDSGWTLTVCGVKLIEAGAEKVYPFALANSGARR